MSNYYNMRDAKVRIAHQLMSKGWEVFGYKKDESDSTTDYYNPAHWEGIATKNGYVLVVDRTENRNSGKDIIKYGRNSSASYSSSRKLAKLAEMREDRGASPEEADTARKMLEKLKAKTPSGPSQVVVGKWPEFMANPGKSKWHIEKDGKIYDKGTGLTKFANMPRDHEFDFDTLTYRTGYTHRTPWGADTPIKRELSAEEQKTVEAFRTLLQRIENIAAGVAPMGDGTDETEAEGLEAQAKQGYEKVAVTETKEVIKPVKVDRLTIEEGDILTFSHHGGYWVVSDIWKNNKGIPCYTYESLGSGKRGYQRLKSPKRYYQTEQQITKGVKSGKIIIHTMQTVTESKEVEKWVKIQPQKTQKTNNSTSHKTPETATDSPEPSPVAHAHTVTADIDTRDNSPLWVVKITDKLSREEYLQLAAQFKTLRGYYSKFKKGFIFRYDPSSVLKGESTAPQAKQTPTPEQTEQQRAEQGEAEKSATLGKIEMAIASLEKRLEKLSGEYQTNTHKRMMQQTTRDLAKESIENNIRVLEYVQGKLVDNLSITELEKGLIVQAFRDEIHNYYRQKYGKYAHEITFPRKTATSASWYNEEVPKKQKRLQKYGINNTVQLNAAVDEYKAIFESVSRFISPLEQKIKKLSNQHKLQQKGDINFTPSAVVERMIQLANIDNNSRVLEPSAGIGNIADKVKEVTKHIEVCERMHSFRELLEMKGHSLVGSDFLEYNRCNYYDAIIMNPPFSNNQDIIHLKHAYRLLKTGGTLVCITSPHWTFANDRASQDFRTWTEEQGYDAHDLPSGTFEMTGVRSQIIVIEKTEEAMQETV